MGSLGVTPSKAMSDDLLIMNTARDAGDNVLAETSRGRSSWMAMHLKYGDEDQSYY